jgi:hypothetical protein
MGNVISADTIKGTDFYCTIVRDEVNQDLIA